MRRSASPLEQLKAALGTGLAEPLLTVGGKGGETDNAVDPSVDVSQCARVMMYSTIAMSNLRHDLGVLTPAAV